MSKAFGLAGLRVGYAVAPPPLAREIEKSRGPYKVSSIAARAAVAALTDGRDWVAERVVEARQVRACLTQELRGRGLDAGDSQANFVFVRSQDATSIAVRLREKGVALRPFTNLTGMGDGLRITVGPWPMLEEALTALDEVLKCE
jgi:histidinol-phosphate/aromatic aminotransferase/cobyric acid decarboxylase-like protein